MTNQSKNSNWGGKREGAGRNTETLSMSQIRKMRKTSKKYAKKYGQTEYEILQDFIRGTGERGSQATVKDSIACLKIWLDYTIAKPEEGGETDKELGPAFYLPEKRPVLAEVKDIKEKK